ncbi:hypothetical protein H0H81_003093 [Sphagnurus paluster]|uniref:Uncharacterized protein n=1 Tax=Sphagnurus paluster TaxID=117069 RepID=A0A9P7FZ86_9AGAR|nr:hypothetical protein H0H81_003093 [Sphagnurus paluster]
MPHATPATPAPAPAPTRNNPLKRGLPTRGADPDGAGSFTSANTPEYIILRYVLKNLTPEQLQTTLYQGMAALRPAQIAALLEALQSVGVVKDKDLRVAEEQTQRHCVRCHKPYVEKDNARDACRIAHMQPELIENETVLTHPGTHPLGVAGATKVTINIAQPAPLQNNRGGNAALIGAIARAGPGGVVLQPPPAQTVQKMMCVEVVYGCCGLRAKVSGGAPGLCFMGRHTTRPENADYDKYPRLLTCDRRGCYQAPAVPRAGPAGALVPARAANAGPAPGVDAPTQA